MANEYLDISLFSIPVTRTQIVFYCPQKIIRFEDKYHLTINKG